MSKQHQQILGEIKKKARANKSFNHSQSYSGSTHQRYGLTNPECWTISKSWARENKDIKVSELVNVLNDLYESSSTDEKKIAGQLLFCLPKQRQEIDPKMLNDWLNDLVGWEEIDSLCQSVFNAKDLLARWNDWKDLIVNFSEGNQIQKRRASLVLLTNVVSQSNDIQFAKLAFSNIEKLKGERDILITKAISWLLRDLIRNHRKLVEEYIRLNMDTLPRIAIREVRNKLTTGKK